MSIGLKRGIVTVQPHRMEWDIAAQEIISKLKNILKDDVVDVQHIGSTSIKVFVLSLSLILLLV